MCSTNLEENEEVDFEQEENRLSALRKILKAFAVEEVIKEGKNEEKELLDLIGSAKLED